MVLSSSDFDFKYIIYTWKEYKLIPPHLLLVIYQYLPNSSHNLSLGMLQSNKI